MPRKHLPWVVLMVLFVTVQAVWSYRPRCAGDFRSFYASGRALAVGANPYHYAFFPDPVSPNANPPLFLSVCRTLAVLPCESAFAVLSILSTLAYATGCALLVRSERGLVNAYALLWLAAATPFWYSIHLGQIYTWLYLLAVIAWIALSRGRLTAAGLSMGVLIAIKPNLTLWPVVLLATNRRRASLVAFLMAGVLTALSVWQYGIETMLDWWALGSSTFLRHTLYPTDMSLLSITTRLRIRPLYPALAAGTLLVATWWAWRARPDWRHSSTLGLSLGLLLAPHAWIGYAILLYPSYLATGMADHFGVVRKILLYVPATVLWALSLKFQEAGLPSLDVPLHLIYAIVLPLTLLATARATRSLGHPSVSVA